MQREKSARWVEFNRRVGEVRDRGCTCPQALGPDGPSAVVYELDRQSCPLHRDAVMKQPHVVGLDTGLTCTGLATAGRTTRTVKIGQKGVTLLPLHLRTKAIVDIGANIVNQCYLSRDEAPDVPDRFRRPDLVVMEAPETSRAFGGLIERIQLYHEIARSLLNLCIPFAIVPSAILKGYATGNGGVDPKKKRVMASVAELWPEYGKVNDDESDAIVLAAMGLDWLTGQRRVPAEQCAKWLHHKSNQWPVGIPSQPRIWHTV